LLPRAIQGLETVGAAMEGEQLVVRFMRKLQPVSA
jgi:hypothetical protein